LANRACQGWRLTSRTPARNGHGPDRRLRPWLQILISSIAQDRIDGLIALGLPFWLAVICAVAMGALGIVLERLVICPILGQPAFSALNRDNLFIITAHIGTAQNNAARPMLFERIAIDSLPVSAAREMHEPFNRLECAFAMRVSNMVLTRARNPGSNPAGPICPSAARQAPS
jgi:hypothetical protein